MKIGKVDIQYNENGKAQFARFVADIEQFESPEILDQLSEIHGTSEEKILNNSVLILSAWFKRMEDKLSTIELSDREKFEIQGVVEKCEKEGEKLRSICVEYHLKELVEPVND